ncbi:leucyl/phenylalanyl-tRNA--protein transferase [Zavarzinella formosa]|uniref:leucyl/phenylalanyl-tRNA--protein transferase n=1 Tax=Zavarzinella formosa TaxID=360055 RepID=UPI0003709488|nr:leucyl/phenylalanyl-tRNA--protein transferase [Zavarzinella formosa]
MSEKPWEDCREVPWVSPRLPDAPPLVGVGGNLQPPMLLRAYTEGIFPWFSEGDPLYWWSPEPRAIFDLHAGMYISKRLARTIRSGKFQTTVNREFETVMRSCGENRDEGTWVTAEMLRAYATLHRLGFAHSVEAWQDGELAGGVYGVAINGFFAAESMFFRRTDGSKVALAALFEHLRERGYLLLDTQMLTEHTESLGGFNIHRKTYLDLLDHALEYDDVTFV